MYIVRPITMETLWAFGCGVVVQFYDCFRHFYRRACFLCIEFGLGKKMR